MTFFFYNKQYSNIQKISFSGLIILLILSSCSEQKKQAYAETAIETLNDSVSKSIEYEVIKTDYLFSYPECLVLNDEHIIIKDEYNKEYLFHAIDLLTGKILYEFAQKGLGPNEYLSSTLNVDFNKDTKTLSFFDPNGRKYHSFIGSYNDNSFVYKHKSEELVKLNENIREIIKKDDRYILTGECNTFNKNRFVVTNESWEVLNASGRYPNVNQYLNTTEDCRQMLYNSVFYKTSPNGKNAIFATYKGSLLEFFDISECEDSIKTIKSLLLDYPIKKEQKDNESDGWIYGFEDVYVTDNYVYAIYNGKTSKENPMFGQNILVYDWHGNIINRYKTDLYLRCIAVNELQKEIYVIACKDDEDFFLAKVQI